MKRIFGGQTVEGNRKKGCGKVEKTNKPVDQKGGKRGDVNGGSRGRGVPQK